MAGQARTRTKRPFEVIRLREERDAGVAPNVIPQTPGLGHGLGVGSHDVIGSQEPQNGHLRESEKKGLFIFFAGRCYGMCAISMEDVFLTVPALVVRAARVVPST